MTGTDTGVGKTIVSAALARPGAAYVKPAQTGDDDDAATVAKLSGAEVHTLARYPEPLAPATAARRAGLPPVTPLQVAEFVRTLQNDLVIIEGAGGLLVRFDEAGGTILDVAALLKAPMIVVARAGLGTLNHTALTVEAIKRRGVTCLGIMIGSWPRDPDLAAECNLEDLTQIAPVLGRIREGEFTTMELPA
ncbi:dethiobiotin synthase [Solirubrobacter phytolaccae]|uniref:ATP-dependent dethiobiotin synthetase BioD n=1 Tax=Solirubrobacter phytolaccae TaxID=1404360 RepID=A0A9X3N894_9ACTN|nr:dethiobiotin synthase [Solirubrobacter phytolaccae]